MDNYNHKNNTIAKVNHSEHFRTLPSIYTHYHNHTKLRSFYICNFVSWFFSLNNFKHFAMPLNTFRYKYLNVCITISKLYACAVLNLIISLLWHVNWIFTVFCFFLLEIILWLTLFLYIITCSHSWLLYFLKISF